MRSVVPATLVIAALFAAGCSKQPAEIPAERLAGLETAFNSDDLAACVALYTDDAEIIAEDSPAVRGHRAIEEYFKDQIAREISLDTVTTFTEVSGDLGVEQGTYRVRNVRIGADVEYGEYLNVWRRGKDGVWKIFRTMQNVTLAQQTSVSVSPAE